MEEKPREMVVYRADVELYFLSFEEAEEWFYDQKYRENGTINVLTSKLIQPKVEALRKQPSQVVE